MVDATETRINPLDAAIRRADHRAETLKTINVGDAVTLAFIGRDRWQGIVRSIDADGMSLTGKRGADVHVTFAKFHRGAMTAVTGKRSFTVRGIWHAD